MKDYYGKNKKSCGYDFDRLDELKSSKLREDFYSDLTPSYNARIVINPDMSNGCKWLVQKKVRKLIFFSEWVDHLSFSSIRDAGNELSQLS